VSWIGTKEQKVTILKWFQEILFFRIEMK